MIWILVFQLYIIYYIGQMFRLSSMDIDSIKNIFKQKYILFFLRFIMTYCFNNNGHKN